VDDKLHHAQGHDRGSIAVMTAVAFPVALIGMGVAIDSAQVAFTRTALQSLTDNGAIAAAKELKVNSIKSDLMAKIAYQFIEPQIQSTAGKSVKLLGISAVKEKEEGVYTLLVDIEQKNYFGGIVNPASFKMTFKTSVKIMSGTKLCVLALDGSAQDTITLTDNAVVQAENCAVQSNSVASSGLTAWNSSKIVAAIVCSGGGVGQNAGNIRPAPLTDCPKVADPLAERKAPSNENDSCDFNWLQVSGTQQRLSPGVYCGGINIAAGANVVLAAGVYIIRGGAFQASNASVLTGKNVALYFSQDATFKFNTEAKVSLSGREDGEMGGLLFFADRKSNPRIHQINSKYAHELVGTIYLPNDTFQVATDAAVADNSAYTAIVARKIVLNQSPRLVLNTNYSATDVPVPAGVNSANSTVVVVK
jgi:Flp pilus assembly protein TadG